MEKVPCNLCGNYEYSILFQGTDLLLNNKEELFTLVKCSNCGLIYQNPRPTRDEITSYYPDEYEPFFQDKKNGWLLRRILHYGVDKRSRIVNSLKKREQGGKLLDVGCSTGLFLSTIREGSSWEVWGVEPSEFAANIARDHYHLNVFTGDLFQANYPENFFHVVTLWDVLEHLPDPSSSLTEISRITTPHGYLVLRIPNADSLDAKLFGASWAGLDLPRHNYVYSTRTLRKLLEKSGFQIISIKCNIGTYPTFMLSVRFWLTNKSVSASLQRRIERILAHPITRVVTAPFFYFYGLLMLGSEITVIAKKL